MQECRSVGNHGCRSLRIDVMAIATPQLRPRRQARPGPQSFKAAATKAIVQQLVRAITFKTVNGTTGARSVIFTVSDGDGGQSSEVTRTVNAT